MNGDPLQVTNRRENWVKFDDNEKKPNENAVISIPTPSPPQSQSPSLTSRKSSSISMQSKNSDMHVVDLSTVKTSIKKIVDFNVSETDTTSTPQQPVFKNGDLIVQVSSEKGRFCWITPAKFRPELVPEEILDRQLSITVEEYVQVVEQLMNDNRFHMYNIFYKKLLGIWIIIAFAIMLSLLFFELEGMMLFFLGVLWLVMNLFAIFATTVCKDYLTRNLEKCLANINLQLLPHKMLLGVDNPGALSCHKMQLNFIYYDSKACLEHLHDLIKQQESNPLSISNVNGGWESRLDVNKCHIMIQNNQSTRVTKSQTRIEHCLLRYSQSWVKSFLRKRLDFPQVRVLFDVSDLNTDVRHLERGFCLCQYVEMILRDKAHNSNAGSFEKFINTIWPISQSNNNQNSSTTTASLPVQAVIAGIPVV